MAALDRRCETSDKVAQHERAARRFIRVVYITNYFTELEAIVS